MSEAVTSCSAVVEDDIIHIEEDVQDRVSVIEMIAKFEIHVLVRLVLKSS